MDAESLIVIFFWTIGIRTSYYYHYYVPRGLLWRKHPGCSSSSLPARWGPWQPRRWASAGWGRLSWTHTAASSALPASFLGTKRKKKVKSVRLVGVIKVNSDYGSPLLGHNYLCVNSYLRNILLSRNQTSNVTMVLSWTNSSIWKVILWLL